MFTRPAPFSVQRKISMEQVASTSGDGLLKRIDDKLRSIDSRDSTKFTIFRVPRTMRDIDTMAYEPKTISIGPYHHQHGQGSKPHLEKMEKDKWVYFNYFLSRNSTSRTHSYADYVSIARRLEADLRCCYSEEISCGSDEFNLMMILDACFLIELFLRGNVFVEGGGHAEEQRTYPVYRATFDQGVCRDLLLLENQIPFFILTEIYNNYLGSSSRCSAESQLVNIASEYFNYHMKTNQKKPTQVRQPDKLWHLLHLVYLLHTPEVLDTVTPPIRPLRGILPRSLSQGPPTVVFPSATRLHEVGIKFQINNGINFPEIRFYNGVLKIPHLVIEGSTKPFISNLVAFEQCVPSVRAYFTPYTVFMDYLINTPKDVEILCKKKIIRNELGCHEDVARLFNEMGEGIVVAFDVTYLTAAFMEVDEYSRRKIPKWRATSRQWCSILRRSYFGNPWLVVSFIHCCCGALRLHSDAECV